jgi:GNAT superfamily N-acetyltransferase
VTDYQNLVIEPISSTHDRLGFSCGVHSLDRYLQKQATQDIKRRISRVYVVTVPKAPNRVIGYYTLSALSIGLNELSDEHARKLPKHPIPAALIGRLAVSTEARGGGIGKLLLVDALKRTLAVGEEIAIYAMVVDAIDERAKSFPNSLVSKHFQQEIAV